MTTTSLAPARNGKAARSAAVLGGALALGALSQAVFGFAIARWFGPQATGSFFIGLAVLTLVGYLGRFGTEQLALREASPAWANSDYDAFRNIAHWMNRTTLRGTVVTSILTLVVLGVVTLVAAPESLVNSVEVWLAVASMAPLNMITTGCALLRAGDRLVVSVTARYLGVFGPALALLAVAVAVDEIPSSPMLAVALSATVVALLVWREVAALTRDRPVVPTEYVAPERRSAATQLTVSTVLNAMLTWVDRLILGAIAGAAAVGIYGVAWQLVLPFNLIHLLSGTISSPTFARLHAAQKLELLETTTRSLSLANALVALVAAGVIVLASPTVLSIIGEEYGSATSLVVILVVGQVVNLSAGQVGVLYAMAGLDRVLLRITTVSAAVSLIATIGLTIPVGATGTAAGVTAGLVVKNLSLALAASKHLGVAPAFFIPRQHVRSTRPVAAIVQMIS